MARCAQLSDYILCSDEPAHASAATLTKLQDKHPKAPVDRLPCPAMLSTSLSVDEAEVLQAVRSFPAGSLVGQTVFVPDICST